MKHNHNPIEHVWHAAKWSIAGLKAAFKYEQAFRIEIFASVFVIPLAFYLGETAIEQVLLLTSWMLVLIAEVINSAIEATVDRISKDFHELSGRAKDLGSAAVFLTSITCVGAWALILLR